MDVKALQFESRFSLPPNSLGYCGRDSAPEKFKQCIITGDCKGVDEEISNFIVLNPYLKTLAEITGKDKLSYEVLEGYWLGNHILNQVKTPQYEILLKYFLEQGVPDFFVEELRLKKPLKFIPTHLFQVLHIGVGKTSGAVPFNLQSINNCMIRWGNVEKIEKKKATITLHSLKANGQKYRLTRIREVIPFSSELLPDLKRGQTVAVHWNMVVKQLTPHEERLLRHWTDAVLNSLY